MGGEHSFTTPRELSRSIRVRAIPFQIYPTHRGALAGERVMRRKYRQRHIILLPVGCRRVFQDGVTVTCSLDTPRPKRRETLGDSRPEKIGIHASACRANNDQAGRRTVRLPGARQLVNSSDNSSTPHEHPAPSNCVESLFRWAMYSSLSPLRPPDSIG